MVIVPDYGKCPSGSDPLIALAIGRSSANQCLRVVTQVLVNDRMEEVARTNCRGADGCTKAAGRTIVGEG
jgi:hypothetical protein